VWGIFVEGTTRKIGKLSAYLFFHWRFLLRKGPSFVRRKLSVSDFGWNPKLSGLRHPRGRSPNNRNSMNKMI